MSQETTKNKKTKDVFDEIDDLELPVESKGKKKEEKISAKVKINLTELKAGLQKIKNEATQLLNLIEEVDVGEELVELDVSQEKLPLVSPEVKIGKAGEKIIEGVFDGQNMVGPDGKIYSVPANYASKSKLIEGDILKLTIHNDGSFIFKQIGPVERERVIGCLIFNEAKSQYYVVLGDQKWKVLTASVTYFKGKVGDEAVILVPKDCQSRWAAVENIIKKFE
jgi:hypothetical protein